MGKREKIIEPAKVSYYFGPGYKDLRDIIKQAWEENADTIDDLKLSRSSALDDVGFFRGALVIFYTFAILAMRIFGAVFFVSISAVHATVLILFMFFMYCVFGVIWGIDRFILWKRKVSHVCTRCQKKYLFPIYICNCGKEHKHLAPGKYGILKRTCECGAELPTSGLKKINGQKRKDLPAICPYCGKEDKQGESVQLVVPIGGGRSSGKSVFINAFVYDFVEDLAINKDFDVDPFNNPYNDEMRRQYEMIKAYYQRGESKRTERENDRTKSSARDFSFWVKHEKFSVPKLIHVLDIDGETFVEGTENFVPEQYKYCQGTILIIDPFAIVKFKNETIEDLNREDKAGIGDEPIINVLNSFVLKLRSVLHLKASQDIKLPVAIAIAKIDAGKLEERIGGTAVQGLMAREPEKYKSYHDAMDYLCRKFLEENEEYAFLKTVDTEFKNVRFFAFSALGHSLRGGRYHPRGVMEIMEWILGQGDSDMKKIWNDSMF